MEPAMATIIWFAGNFAPKGWAFCQGQLLPINQNQALFSLLGTTYGGDGRTTFGLPDFRGRAALGVSGSHPLGQRAGAETATMTVATMPNHTHTATAQVSVSTGAASTDEANGNTLGVTTSNNFAPAASANGALGGTTFTDAPTGGSQPFNIRQPYLGINTIICIFGIFPSRN